MADRNSPVTEDELHLYVDGELTADRQKAVESWLASHPEDAALVAAWRLQADSIRSRFSPVVSEPIPSRLSIDRITRSRRSWAGIAAAATIAAFILGGAAGWLVRGASVAKPSPFDNFASEALDAHRLYIAEMRHPIEVTATENHLIPWLSRRVGTSLRAPDLTAFGLRLLGGRLLPGPNGPAALFMYEGTNGDRYTIYASKLPVPQTALHYNTMERITAAQWVESEFGYVVSGPADKNRIAKIAQSVYEQMEQRAPERDRTNADQLMSRRGS